MATLTFRNSEGELVDVPTVAASRFKNEFSANFEKAALNDLSVQFDGLLERMKTPKARRGMASAFDASPTRLGRGAVKAAASRAD